MALLTDTDLERLICSTKDWQDKNKLHIYPYAEDSLTPVGYDVRVGTPYASSLAADLFELKEGENIQINPGDTVLVTTLESIDMPQDRSLSAFITSKVSKVSKGLSHISTNIDPDWRGKLLIAMHNPSKNRINLKYGDSLCTLNFIKNLSSSTRDCERQPGRLDILLKQFVSDHKKYRQQERSEKMRSFLIKGAVIFAFAIVGFLVFNNNPGFIASAAIGIAVAGNLPLSKKGL
jgi:deoxycytidine triphosphate deaminase